MKAAVLYFSRQGEKLALSIGEVLKTEYEEVEVCPGKPLMDTAARLFESCRALVFIGSCGIAVRAIAPLVASKKTDPAVLVADDGGKHVISLLSGHIGGANRLALLIAEAIGAEPVITTATDVNGRFAADQWAARRGFVIDSMDAARDFAAAILKEDLPVYSEFPVEKLHDSLYPVSGRAEEAGNRFNNKIGLSVSCRNYKPFEETLLVIPKLIHLGIGCRRGTTAAAIEEAVLSIFEEYKLDIRAVSDVSSVDLKKDEEGLLEFCSKYKLKAHFYSPEELNRAPGEYRASEFVKKTVGTDNVCERAAVLRAAQTGRDYRIIVHKTAADGVTLAAALEIRRLEIE